MERFNKGPRRRPAAAILAGLVYGAGVFLLGCLLGVVRMVVLEPRSGALTAVLAEVPLMLTAAWLLSSRLIYRFAVTSTFVDRSLMGVAGGVCLMLGELELAVLLDRTPVMGVGNPTPARLVGLAGQAMFVLTPLLQLLLAHRSGWRA